MSQSRRDAAAEAEPAQDTVAEDAKKPGPVVTEAMVTPLKEALRALLAEALPADEVEPALVALLHRLHAGLQHLRPNKQLAPWMHGVLCRLVAAKPLPEQLTPGDPTGQDRVAAGLVPFLEALTPDHAEALLFTDHGPLTQQAAADRLGLTRVAFKSRVNSARIRLRVAVLAGLAFLLDGASRATSASTATDPNPDTRAPRRRFPASALLPALTAGLEQLVIPWVPEEHAATTAQAILARLRAGIEHLSHNARLPRWIHAVTREVVLSAPWSSSSAEHLDGPRHPERPTPESRAMLAPALNALLERFVPNQTRALVLVDLDGHSQHGAAGLEGLLPEAFKQRLWRARRHAWSTLIAALAEGRRPEPSTPAVDALIGSLQALVDHLAPGAQPAPVVQRVLRQLHQDAHAQRPTSSLVEHLYSQTLAALLPRPTVDRPSPPATPGPSEVAALAVALAPLLAALTPEQGEAISRFDLNNLTLTECATALNLDRPTFQGRLQRARIRLRLLLTGCLTAPALARSAESLPPSTLRQDRPQG